MTGVGGTHANAHFAGKLGFPEGLLKCTKLGSRGAGAWPQANSQSLCSQLAGAGKLTVLRHLQDVAEQGAVAIEGLGPRQVDGPPLRGAEGRHGVLGGVRQLPGGERCGGATCEACSQGHTRAQGSDGTSRYLCSAIARPSGHLPGGSSLWLGGPLYKAIPRLPCS